jgi:hypothetical protein
MSLVSDIKNNYGISANLFVPNKQNIPGQFLPLFCHLQCHLPSNPPNYMTKEIFNA